MNKYSAKIYRESQPPFHIDFEDINHLGARSKMEQYLSSEMIYDAQVEWLNHD